MKKIYSTMKPTNSHFKNEIIRRCKIQNLTLKDNESPMNIPRFSRWKAKDLVHALEHTYIIKTDSADEKFLSDATAKLQLLLIQVKVDMMKADEKAKALSTRKTGWTSDKPFYRLVHIFGLEEFRIMYEKTFNSLTQEQLDQPKGTRPIDIFWKNLCLKYLDPNFKPKTHILPLLHDDFKDEIDLSLDGSEIPTDVTAKDLQEKWNSMRHMLLRVCCSHFLLLILHFAGLLIFSF